MKMLNLKSLVITLMISQLIAETSYTQIGLYEELMSLSGIDLLPQYRVNTTIHQISSYDTTGGNDDGFSGKYSYLRKENDDFVIADIKGSGVINRMWTPTPTEDTIQFYFDGEETPRISLKFIDLFTGNIYPFSRPVVGNEVGGYYSYLPIPYQKSCKIIFKGKLMRFIQIDYRQFTDQTTVSTFPVKLSEKESGALALAIKAWNSFGKGVMDLIKKPDQNIKTKNLTVSLKRGETVTIFKDNNGGRIIGIEITPYSNLNSLFKDVIFKASWDNDKFAAIVCPVSDFFGYAYGKPSMQSMLIGVNNRLHYCYLPMPYEKKADLELKYLKNDQNVADEIFFNAVIYYSENKLSKNEGKLYAKWKREKNPAMGKPYTILETEGHGHYVGTLLQSQGLNPGITTFFEGDDQCYIDGKLTLHGTGSEDYFNGGWYALADRWDQGYSLPVHGALDYSIPLGRTGGYRFYINDKIPFSRSFHLTIEHGPTGNNIPVDYTSVAFFYCNQPPADNEIPVDELLEEIKPPSIMEYWLALLPINSFSNRSAISYERFTTPKSKSYDVFKFTSRENGFIKFELEVPVEGNYNLYISYIKDPSSGSFQVLQRQIPVSKIINGQSDESIFVDREFIGSVNIKTGTNTITVMLKGNTQPAESRSFILHRIYLEKL